MITYNVSYILDKHEGKEKTILRLAFIVNVRNEFQDLQHRQAITFLLMDTIKIVKRNFRRNNEEEEGKFLRLCMSYFRK